MSLGESNAAHATQYACSYPAMIDDWRKHFHDASDGETDATFPFGFVQVRV
jgi:sialate O-acetylesterase